MLYPRGPWSLRTYLYPVIDLTRTYSAAGKILRRQLRDMAKEELLLEQPVKAKL